MTGQHEPSDPSVPKAAPAIRHVGKSDDRWLSDLPNDLGALGLCSDDVPALTAEMDCSDLKAGPAKPHRHDDFGI